MSIQSRFRLWCRRTESSFAIWTFWLIFLGEVDVFQRINSVFLSVQIISVTQEVSDLCLAPSYESSRAHNTVTLKQSADKTHIQSRVESCLTREVSMSIASHSLHTFISSPSRVHAVPLFNSHTIYYDSSKAKSRSTKQLISRFVQNAETYCAFITGISASPS
jgi:hypothetical protein